MEDLNPSVSETHLYYSMNIKIKISRFKLLLFLFSLIASISVSAQKKGSWDFVLGIDGIEIGRTSEYKERAGFGATLGANHWFNPTIGCGTQFYGYFGTPVSYDDHKKETYATLEESFLLNLSSFWKTKKQVYDLIPHIGLGYSRNFTYNDNSLAYRFGLNNSFKISNRTKLTADLGWHISGNKHRAGQYGGFYCSLGVRFALGKEKLKKETILSEGEEISTSNLNNLYDNDLIKQKIKQPVIDGTEGMVFIERGHIQLGNAENDSLWQQNNELRGVSVDDIWMDQTEVTNKQYKQFINDVVQKTFKERMTDPYFNGDSIKALKSLYNYNPITHCYTLDGNQLFYAYETYNELDAARKGNDIIQKDTAYINEDGDIVNETITRAKTGPWDYLNTYIVNVLPDTTVWVNDFPNSDNSMYLKYYFSHPDYDDYPVVGVTWEQANAYCAWRTERRKEKLGGDLGYEQPYRLPTEAEWEHAARGNSGYRFPWKKEMERYGYALLANFQPEEGDYTKDGNIITSKVGVFPPNSNNLYDMAGNVAEWTSTPYSISGVTRMNNINPQLQNISKTTEQYKRKVVRGGSWKDSESHILSAWRTFENQATPRSYIGFRCVKSIATKKSERIIKIKKDNTTK